MASSTSTTLLPTCNRQHRAPIAFHSPVSYNNPPNREAIIPVIVQFTPELYRRSSFKLAFQRVHETRSDRTGVPHHSCIWLFVTAMYSSGVCASRHGYMELRRPKNGSTTDPSHFNVQTGRARFSIKDGPTHLSTLSSSERRYFSLSQPSSTPFPSWTPNCFHRWRPSCYLPTQDIPMKEGTAKLNRLVGR